MSPLEQAIAAAGSISALAAAIGSAASAPSMWKARGSVPAEQCPDIERATGITCEALRPDIRWHRAADPSWPNPNGRPCIDVAAAVPV